MKEKTLNLRIDKELHEALAALAAQDSRTVSDYVRLTLIDHVQKLYQTNGKVFREHGAPRKGR